MTCAPPQYRARARYCLPPAPFQIAQPFPLPGRVLSPFDGRLSSHRFPSVYVDESFHYFYRFFLGRLVHLFFLFHQARPSSRERDGLKMEKAPSPAPFPQRFKAVFLFLMATLNAPPLSIVFFSRATFMAPPQDGGPFLLRNGPTLRGFSETPLEEEDLFRLLVPPWTFPPCLR